MAKLFVALEAHAPWQETFPPGRILDEEARHLTLAFLGESPLDKAVEVVSSLPPPYPVGPIAITDKLLLLPHRHPRTAGYHFELIRDPEPLQTFYSKLLTTLQEAGLTPSHPERPLLNHITVARHPEELDTWKETFAPLPLFLKDLHLYESLGYSKYRSHYCLSAKPPFEEIPHTADIAFHIWGKTITDLYFNAACALAFHFPPLIIQTLSSTPFDDLGEVVIALNELVAKTDEEMGCPFKAVSFHGEIAEQDNLLYWEMIVDV